MASDEGETTARPRTTIGGAMGLHLPGVFPEPDEIVAEQELSPHEQAILDDLHEALGPEDADSEDPLAAVEGDAAAPEIVMLPRERAQLPWWYGVAALWIAGPAMLVGGVVAASGGNWLPGLLLLAAGFLLTIGGINAYRNRHDSRVK